MERLKNRNKRGWNNGEVYRLGFRRLFNPLLLFYLFDFAVSAWLVAPLAEGDKALVFTFLFLLRHPYFSIVTVFDQTFDPFWLYTSYIRICVQRGSRLPLYNPEIYQGYHVLICIVQASVFSVPMKELSLF